MYFDVVSRIELSTQRLLDGFSLILDRYGFPLQTQALYYAAVPPE